MLIVFKGKGCTECPFVEIIEMAMHQEVCGLAFTFPNKYKLPLLVYSEEEKPDGCPFKTGKKIEVTAMEST